MRVPFSTVFYFQRLVMCSAQYMYTIWIFKMDESISEHKVLKPKMFFRFIFVNKIRLPPPFDILEM